MCDYDAMVLAEPPSLNTLSREEVEQIRLILSKLDEFVLHFRPRFDGCGNVPRPLKLRPMPVEAREILQRAEAELLALIGEDE